ncbi:MAG: flagellar motor switch protein FliN [Candidatus Nitrospinota bacterium M3_3B_026]
MGDEELNAENEEDLWAAAAEDLAQQKEMLKKAGEQQPQEEDAGGEGGESGEQESHEPAESAPQAGPPAKKAAGGEASEVDRILDIPLQVTVELGRSKMLINDLLQLGQGSVIELTKLVGEPLEVLVNDQLVGKGEVVVVNEKFGIRITEITSHKERIESIG